VRCGLPGRLGAAGLPLREGNKKTARLLAEPDGLTVGVAGFEPTTSSSRTKRATKLRHTPMALRPQ
jgi:hypothetical protein